MRLIKQKFETSCGIACAAMLCGKSHNTVMRKAIDLFEWNPDPKFLKNNSRTNSKDLIKLLAEFGVTGKLKKFKSWNDLDAKNILAVRYNENTDRWHWIVVERKNSGIVIFDSQKEKRIVIKTGRKPDGRSYGRNPFYIKIW